MNIKSKISIVLVMVFAVALVSPIYAFPYVFPVWTDESNITKGTDYTMQICDEVNYTNVLHMSKLSGYADNSYCGVRQFVDPALLTSGHTYRMEASVKMSSATPTWMICRFGNAWEDFIAPYTPNYTNWSRLALDKTVGDDLALFVEFQCANLALDCWVDNVVVYDVGDQQKTNLIQNGDFEDVPDSVCIDNLNANVDALSPTITYDGTDLYVSSATNDTSGLIAGVYKDDRLVDIKLAFPNGTSKTSIKFEDFDTSTYVKAFCWNGLDNISPIAEAKTYDVDKN